MRQDDTFKYEPEDPLSALLLLAGKALLSLWQFIMKVSAAACRQLYYMVMVAEDMVIAR